MRDEHAWPLRLCESVPGTNWELDAEGRPAVCRCRADGRVPGLADQIDEKVHADVAKALGGTGNRRTSPKSAERSSGPTDHRSRKPAFARHAFSASRDWRRVISIAYARTKAGCRSETCESGSPTAPHLKSPCGHPPRKSLSATDAGRGGREQSVCHAKRPLALASIGRDGLCAVILERELVVLGLCL